MAFLAAVLALACARFDLPAAAPHAFAEIWLLDISTADMPGDRHRHSNCHPSEFALSAVLSTMDEL